MQKIYVSVDLQQRTKQRGWHELMARLLNLIEKLQTDQLNDPMNPELVLLREFEKDEAYIVNVYLAACIFGLNRGQLQAQFIRDLKQRFITSIDLIDNLLEISLTEIVRLEQQQ